MTRHENVARFSMVSLWSDAADADETIALVHERFILAATRAGPPD